MAAKISQLGRPVSRESTARIGYGFRSAVTSEAREISANVFLASTIPVLGGLHYEYRAAA